MTGPKSPLARSPLLQLATIFACWGAGEGVMRGLRLHLPGSLAGMAILLLLLATGAVKVSSLRSGTQLLLADMLLFFVPAVPAVVDHPEFLGMLGLRLLLVILAGTAIVMAVTAASIEIAGRIFRREP